MVTPPFAIIALTSAKSRLIRDGRVIVSTIPLTISATNWSMIEKASSNGRLGTKWSSRLLSRTNTASATCLRLSRPSSALFILCLRSTWNGVVTIPTTSAPAFLASSATIGQIPVPEPPPSPLAMKTKSAPVTIL